jgi:hypothetical protein
MKNTDFCYWLQGFFELTSENQNYSLNSQQIQTIKDHLKLVRMYDKKLDEFPAWLEGFLDNIHDDASTNTESIRTKLHYCFEHVIDPLYEKTGLKDKLNQIHSGFDRPIRC